MTNKRICPSCGKLLQKQPKRKVACPHCGQLIFVRKGTPVTEDRAKELDAIKKLEMYEITDKQFQERRSRLSNKFGLKASVGDTTWGIYNELASQAMKETNFQILSSLYLDMSNQLISDGKQGYRSLREESQRMSLYEYKKSAVFKKVKSLTVNDQFVCKACKEFSSKEHLIDDILEKSVFPATNCISHVDKKSPGVCRCYFIPIIDSESWNPLA